MENKKNNLTSFVGAIICSVIAGVIVLVVEYGIFQVKKSDTQTFPNKNGKIDFPNGNAHPSHTIRANIGKMYRLFLHNPEAGDKEYGKPRILEVSGAVGSKDIVSPEGRPFVLVLESDGHKLFCFFNDEDTIKGITSLHRVTIQGKLYSDLFKNSNRQIGLVLFDCKLVSKNWKISVYLAIGLPAFLISVLILLFLARKLFHSVKTT